MISLKSASGLADPCAVPDALVRRAEPDFGEIAVGPLSSRLVDGRHGVGIDRERIARRVNELHLVARTTTRNRS